MKAVAGFGSPVDDTAWIIPAASSPAADTPGRFPAAGSGCESAPARTAPATGRKSGPWPDCRDLSAPADSGWW